MGRQDREAISRAHHRAIAVGTALLCAAALGVTSATAVPTATLAGASTASDPGAEKRKVDSQIEKLREELEDSSAELSNAYIALQTTKSQLPAAQAALAQAESIALAADRANTLAAQELEAARASEAKAQAELEATAKEVATGRARVAQFAAQIYQEQGFGQLDMALSSTNPQQFADRIALVDTVMDVQGETLDRLATEQASQTALEDHLSALRADSAEKKKRAEAALAAAESARDSAARAKADLDALAARQASQAAAVESQIAADKARLGVMQAEQSRLKAVLAARAAEARRKAAAAAKAEAARRAAAAKAGRPSSSSGGSSSDEASGGFLSRPMSGRVSSEYGMRFHPIHQYWRLHSGRDYAAPCGTPVRAAAPGEIIMAGDGGGYGKRIVIDHGIVEGEHLATTYNHLQGYAQRSGNVSRGEVIGYEGSTGTSTGCHLHFETLQNGDFVDPRRWL
ncbi:MAG TPA: peptidoglycan DD-metalloendopeptidase family protein [Ornithinibacter sp.]|nr:peptidoglycan DD-metalloendopeptidase family protein [Ornithinibacter sp.]